MVDFQGSRAAGRGARLAAASAVFYLLAACSSLAPDTRPPAMDMPAAWPSDAPVTGDGGAGAAADWWTMFGDPALDRLVAEGLQNNRDVALAVARVEEARGLAALAR